MKLEMSIESLKQIYKVCSAHVSKDKYRLLFNYIHVTLKGDVATAIALDGAKLAQCEVSAKGDEGTYILPMCKPPKGEICVIENTDTTMSIDFVESKHEELLPNVEKVSNTYANQFLPKSNQVTIGFNPDYMAKACASLKGFSVKMEISDATHGIVLSNELGMVLVLPVRL